MSESLHDKNYIENLLNALSITEALEVFATIDNKILQLLECSADDFLSLNDHFKAYYKDSKKISQNANEIIELITNPTVNNNFQKLQANKDIFHKLNSLLTVDTQNIEQQLNKVLNKYESLYIAHNNFKQNLSSLKLVSNKLVSGSNSEQTTDETNIKNAVESIKTTINTATTTFELLKTQILECLVVLSDLKKKNYEPITSLKEKFEASIQLFISKHHEASSLIPNIKSQSDKCSSSIATIITNLQYHDIIRQKIEHIQHTHQDILNELHTYSTDDTNLTQLHNRAKTFLKIRDIAGLQAAQLLHANKQYQQAIIEIAKNLEDIGNEMISITQQCEHLTEFTESTQNHFLNNITENLSSSNNYTQSVSSLISLLSVHLDSINKPLTEFDTIYANLKQQNKNINQHLENTVAQNSENNIIEISKSLKEAENNIQAIHIEIKDTLNNLLTNNTLQTIKELLENINNIQATLPSLIDVLKNNNKQIEDIHQFNSSVSKYVIVDIKESIKKIKYYDLFEKVSEEIIENLNGLNIKLNYGNNEKAAQNRADNLKHLKERYTMASEHIIHDHITRLSNGSNVNDEVEQNIIDFTNENSESDDDNLELF